MARVLLEGSRDLIKATDRKTSATSCKLELGRRPSVPVVVSGTSQVIPLSSIAEDYSKTRENAPHVYNIDSVRPTVWVKVRQNTLIPRSHQLCPKTFLSLLVHHNFVREPSHFVRLTSPACWCVEKYLDLFSFVSGFCGEFELFDEGCNLWA